MHFKGSLLHRPIMDNIILILLILAAVGYWWDTQRCNEIALFICRNKCHSAGLQLLDATVIRQRTWLRKGPAGVQICRLYSFEYSTTSASTELYSTAANFGQREQGYIVLIGTQVVEVNMPRDAKSVQDTLS